ncbi:MAG: YegP family protein, partial [Candidatus Methanomethylophilaceae archaeon]|nr:YegP family protein [Candidatus Methanomethylophilaceae archaeon]
QTYSTKKTALAGIESVKKNAGSDIEDQTLAEPVAVKNPKWEIYNDKAGEFRFRLKASNGEIILASQGYSSKASCKNGIESVKTNAPEAEVEVLEE